LCRGYLAKNIIDSKMKRKLKKLLKNSINSIGYDFKITKRWEDIELYTLLYGNESVFNKRFYDISAGGHFEFGKGLNHPCWTNVDFASSNQNKNKHDIFHDLLSLSPLPIDSNSSELVHSQYTLEHITNEAAHVLFTEVYRILKSKGVFRIVVPNFELDYIAYKNNDISYFYWMKLNSKNEINPLYQASLEQCFLLHFAANASILHKDGAPLPINDNEFKSIMSTNNLEDAMNICTSRCSVEKQKKYRHDHINWWTHEKLKSMLNEAGFKTTYILAPSQSSTQVMRNKTYFDKYFNEVALFMEAVKN
jgi:ubiquinone/menaquinone biosynthesis C-methylase UbiE